MHTTSTKLLGGRYQLLERLAGGGMGEVWRAEDQRLSRWVAVKVLRPEYADNDEFRERLRIEGRIAASVSHPGLARVYDYGVDATNEPYLVMEFVDGRPLSAILVQERTMAPVRVLGIVAQVAAGLFCAHRAGLVHRDVKPGNLLVRDDGTVKITDFGIARAAGDAPLTRTGMIMGTPQYLSPEQASGRTATPASDLYSLGLIAYECLTGYPPFEGDALGVALAHRDQAMPPLPATVPEPVARLIDALTEKNPVARPPDADAVAEWAYRLLDDVGVAAALAGPITPPAGPVGAGSAGSQAQGAGHRRGMGLAAAVLLSVAGVAGVTGWDLHRPALSRAMGASTADLAVDPSRYQGRALADVISDLHRLRLRTTIHYQAGGGRPGTVTGVSPAGSVKAGTPVVVYAVGAPSAALTASLPTTSQPKAAQPRSPGLEKGHEKGHGNGLGNEHGKGDGHGGG
jgi:serine/threonine-protein kinase